MFWRTISVGNIIWKRIFLLDVDSVDFVVKIYRSLCWFVLADFTASRTETPWSFRDSRDMALGFIFVDWWRRRRQIRPYRGVVPDSFLHLSLLCSASTQVVETLLRWLHRRDCCTVFDSQKQEKANVSACTTKRGCQSKSPTMPLSRQFGRRPKSQSWAKRTTSFRTSQRLAPSIRFPSRSKRRSLHCLRSTCTHYSSVHETSPYSLLSNVLVLRSCWTRARVTSSMSTGPERKRMQKKYAMNSNETNSG